MLLLSRNQLTPSDIQLLIPHQANLRINQKVSSLLELKPTQLFNNIQKFGNTTSASLPICMQGAIDEKKLKKNDLVLTLVFGAGFTWGGNLIRW